MGGTFTDGFFSDDSRTITCKVPTHRFDLTRSVIQCLRAGAEAFGEDVAGFFERVAVLRLASTVGTNAVVEGTGSRVGLLVEGGEEEALYGGRPAEALFETFLDRQLVRGCGRPLDPESFLRSCAELIQSGVRQVVISFEAGAETADREHGAEAIVRGRYPEHYLRSVPLQLSTEVTACREPDVRTSTAVVNAYLHRDMASLLHRAEQELRAEGLSAPLLVVHANSGVARVAKSTAISTYSSGPSAGLSGAEELAAMYEDDLVVTADMGGTTLDLGFVLHGACETETRPNIAGVPVALHMNRTISLGMGGCSIASLGPEGVRLGPESAGSVPGPASFGRGGKLATLTDADVVTGLLEDGAVFGAQFTIQADPARAAMEAMIGDRGMTVEEGAVAIEASAARSISSSLSDVLAAGPLDPRSVVLYVFGGAGPLHLPQAAQQAGISRIRTFPFGSAFSAFGCTVVDIRHRYEAAWYGQSPGADEVIAASRSLYERAMGDVRGEEFSIGLASVRLLAFGKDGVQVASSAPVRGDRSDVLGLVAASLIGEVQDWGAVETLALEISVPVSDRVEHPPKIRSARSSPSVKGRDVWWGNDVLNTRVFLWEDVPFDGWVEGPALVVQQDTTHAVAPGWGFRLDELGNGEWRALSET